MSEIDNNNRLEEQSQLITFIVTEKELRTTKYRVEAESEEAAIDGNYWQGDTIDEWTDVEDVYAEEE